MIDKVVFLDIDGPMISFKSQILGRFPIERGPEKFDPVAVHTVVRLLEMSGAKLVISSSWRHSGRERLVQILELNGIKEEHLHNDWRTSIDSDQMIASRGWEINDWLKRHPEVKTYAALDDCPLNGEYYRDLCKECNIEPKDEVEYAIRIDPFDGMSFDNQKKLFDIFGLSVHDARK